MSISNHRQEITDMYLDQVDYDPTEIRFIPPQIWGPHYWYVFHTYANSYPDNPTNHQQAVASNLIKTLPFLLPCDECASHAYTYIKTVFSLIPTIVLSKTNLINFFNTFHNHVNERLGKPKFFF